MMGIQHPDEHPEPSEFRLLKASAGSGKTRALTRRFAQFLLSEEIPKNDLRNILAITFTRNAAKEMKTRILDLLKACAFGDLETMNDVPRDRSIPEGLLPQKAGAVVDRILDRYTDFEVETIDSFMTTIFRASAVELGFSPEFEIVLDGSEYVRYAFSRLLHRVSPGSGESREFLEILDLLLSNLDKDSAFPWDPAAPIAESLVLLSKKLSVHAGELKFVDYGRQKLALQDDIVRAASALKALIDRSGLEKTEKGDCHKKILPSIAAGHFTDLIGCSFATPPVKKPRTRAGEILYGLIDQAWTELKRCSDHFRSLYARDYYRPYLAAYRAMEATLGRVKRGLGIVFLSDINRQLVRYIEKGIVPDIYFRLGERVFHYLIDEFQDTNRIQWKSLRPLIEESLSQGGSLFAVGDMKQAIFGFRDADYRIMKNLNDKTEGFASAKTRFDELRTNFRSAGKIQGFVKQSFLQQLPLHPDYEAFPEAQKIYAFDQDVIEANRDKGYVEFLLLERDQDSRPEKTEIQERIRELHRRGFAWSEMAVLTYQNKTVVEVSSWLNEREIPFIPFSSLDIRRRKIVGEVLAFLEFLDSPPDDLSFSKFLLGGVFRKAVNAKMPPGPEKDFAGFLFDCREAERRPLYVAFRKAYPALWERFFEPFFKTVGFYPLYDLVTLVYRIFDMFDGFGTEEAALTKLLEVIKNFERKGRNDLQAFLEFSETEEGEESAWTLDRPSEIPAVRIMSIHKAKGLEFPVVVGLFYEEKFQAPDFYFSEDETAISVLKLNKKLAANDGDRELHTIYEDVRERDFVERLNRLYVGLTRAKEELYVIAVKGKTDAYPINLLMPAAKTAGYLETETNRWASSPEKPIKSIPALATLRSASENAKTLRLKGPFELPSNLHESLNAENIHRGEIAHQILAELESLHLGWEADIDEVIANLNPAASDAALFKTIGRSLAAFFRSSPLGALFERKPDRRILRECSFCDSSGRVFRMDRVVVDPESAIVIDFKTGAAAAPSWPASDQANRDQVAAYVRILKEIFTGKSVQGILAHIDRKTWEIVE